MEERETERKERRQTIPALHLLICAASLKQELPPSLAHSLRDKVQGPPVNSAAVLADKN